MSTATRLTGTAAIAHAIAHGLRLNKYEDPTEAAREGLTPAEAREVAREDATLIYLDVPEVGGGGDTETVRMRYAGDTATLTWRPAHAGTPLVLDGAATQWQVADAGHSTTRAALLVSWLAWGREAGHSLEAWETEYEAEVEWDVVTGEDDARAGRGPLGAE